MNENDLFRAWRTLRDRESLVALLRGLQGSIYNLCFHVLRHPHDAEDAAQKVLLELLRILPSLTSLDSLRAWLYRASLLTALNLKRGERRRMRYERADRPDRTPPLSDEDVEGIHEQIADLRNDLRTLVVRHYFDQRTLEDLAKEEGCSTVAVWKKLQKAQEELRRSLMRVGVPAGALALAAFLESREAAALPHGLLSPAVLEKGVEGMVLAGGMAVKSKILTWSVTIGLLSASLLGVGVVHRRDAGVPGSLSAAAVGRSAAPVPAPKLPATSTAGSADSIVSEPVLIFKSGEEFQVAVHRALVIADESESRRALRRLGLKGSDGQLRRSCDRLRRSAWNSVHHFLRNHFDLWIASDPGSCARFIDSLPLDQTTDSLLLRTLGALLKEKAASDPRSSLDFLKLLSRRYLITEFQENFALQERFLSDPGAFVEWVRSLPSGGVDHPEAVAIAIPHWAATEPSIAVAWIEAQSDGRRTALLRAIAKSWSEKPPEASPWLKRCLESVRSGSPLDDATKGVAREFLLGVAEEDSTGTADPASRWISEVFQPLMNQALATLAERDPVWTARYVESLPFDAWSVAAVDVVSRRWARSDPRAALAWLSHQSFQTLRGDAYLVLLRQWAGEDGPSALAAVEALPERIRKGARAQVFDAWAQSDPSAAARQTDAGSDPSTIGSIARSWALADPEAALTWVRSRSTSAERDAGLAGVTISLCHDLDAAMEVAGGISNPGRRRQATERTLLQAAAGDPVAASEALRKVGPLSVETCQEIARAFSYRDPAEALAWLATLPSEVQDLVRSGLVFWISSKNPEGTRKAVEESSLDPDTKKILLSSLASRSRRR